MKLEVGMYVRTLKGIVKIDEIKDDVMKDTKGYLHYGDFIKASHNIIDLIEEGDYVNGYPVIEIPYMEENKIVYKLYYKNNFLLCTENHKIKSIVTKEQFESMSYKVGE